MLLDELIERAFCEGYEYAQKEFSKKKKKNNSGERLEDISSHRGLGRAAAIGGISYTLPATLIGGYKGKKKAEELDRQGKSDREIIRESGKHAARWGAGIGAGIGAGVGAAAGSLVNSIHKKMGTGQRVNPLLTAANVGLSGALWGGVGAYAGAKKNAEDRIEKRNKRR